MLIHVSPNNPMPMYEQITSEIQRLIVNGMLEADEMLPSIRELSKQLTTSAITVRRAYQELENSGFIYTRAGKGSFVAQMSHENVMDWKMKQVQEPLIISIEQAQKLDVSREQFHQITEWLWEEIKAEKSNSRGGLTDDE